VAFIDGTRMSAVITRTHSITGSLTAKHSARSMPSSIQVPY